MPAVKIVLKISRLNAPVGHFLLLSLVLGLALPGLAQENETEPFDLPDTNQVLDAVVDSQRRPTSLAALYVLDQALNRHAEQAEGESVNLADRIRSDWNWINRLLNLKPVLLAQSGQRDMLGMLLQRELDQHQLQLWPNLADSQEQLSQQARQAIWDRAQPALATALLGPVLAGVELRSSSIWQRLQTDSQSDPGLAEALAAVPPEFWSVFAPVEDLDRVAAGSIQRPAINRLQSELEDRFRAAVTDSATELAPLEPLRKQLLQAAGEATENRVRIGILLVLGSALEALENGHYLEFAWKLIDMGACIAQEHIEQVDPAPCSATAQALLFEILPLLSATHGLRFTETDARINSALADIFDILQTLQDGQEIDQTALRTVIMDAHAKMLLLVPDSGYYLEQPVRRNIGEEIDICTSIAATVLPDSDSSISREQFDGCMDSFLALLKTDIQREALAGNRSGPFERDQLRRELSLTPWQRINYTLGYLDEKYAAACDIREQSLVNPFEWALITGIMRWFADQWPVYFRSPENEVRLQQMLAAGEQLIEQLQMRSDCLTGLGDPMSDIVTRLVDEYHMQINQLLLGIQEVQQAFRDERLKGGADIDLNGNARQTTRYRPESIEIAPCNSQSICEMEATLSANRGLIDLFPPPFLIADQARLGDIEICYDQVNWVDRRSQKARENDDHVANYYGRFSFELKGRFRQEAQATDVFILRFTSPKEYHYLFAANDPALLDQPCPMDQVGQSVLAELSTSALPIVPKRLTYLTAARTLPSRLFDDNWDRGAEWQDWFVSGSGIDNVLTSNGSEMIDPVNQHLSQLHRELELAVYSALLSQPLRIRGETQMSLAEQVADVSQIKALLKAAVLIHYPNQLLFNDRIRASLEGSRASLDYRALRRLRDNQTPLEEIPAILLSRIDELEQAWLAEPEALRRLGSISPTVSLAWLQLKELNHRYFEIPPQAPEEQESDADEPIIDSDEPGESTSPSSPEPGLSASVLPAGQQDLPSPPSLQP